MMITHSTEAEKRIIAQALSVPAVFWSLSKDKGLTADMFYIPSHQIVFEAMEWLHRLNGSPDRSLIAKSLQGAFVDIGHNISMYDYIGGDACLSRLAQTPYDTTQLADDIQDVVDWYHLRVEWRRLYNRMR